MEDIEATVEKMLVPFEHFAHQLARIESMLFALVRLNPLLASFADEIFAEAQARAKKMGIDL